VTEGRRQKARPDPKDRLKTPDPKGPEGRQKARPDPKDSKDREFEGRGQKARPDPDH